MHSRKSHTLGDDWNVNRFYLALVYKLNLNKMNADFA